MAYKIIQLKDGNDIIYPAVGSGTGTTPMYFKRITNESDLDSALSNNTYQILYGLISNALFISFDIGWIRLQFKVQNNNAWVRTIYGQSAASAWRSIG